MVSCGCVTFALGWLCGCFAICVGFDLWLLCGICGLVRGWTSGFVSWMLSIVYTSVLVASLIFGVLLWLVVCGTVSLVFGGLCIAFMVVLVSSLVIVLGLMVLWVLFIAGLWLFCWFIVVLCVEFVVLYFWGLFGVVWLLWFSGYLGIWLVWFVCWFGWPGALGVNSVGNCLSF